MSSASATQSRPALEHYRTVFERRFAADPLVSERRAALTAFLEQGFPTPRDERWKYTNLRRLETRAFVPGEAAPIAFDPQHAPWIAQAGLRFVFVNGHFAPALSSAQAQLPGVTLVRLADRIKHEPAAACDYLSRASQQPLSSLEQLNAAFFEDGLFVQLAPGTQLDQPIHVVHLWTDQAQLGMSHPRLIVRAGADSRVTLIEQFISTGAVESFTNAVADLALERGAVIDHYRLQEESTKAFHIGHARVAASEQARYALHDLALGASLGRLDLTVYLKEPRAHAELRGLIAPTGSQHLDTHTRIEHIAPHTTSSEEYRGIADGRGRGVFNGKVLVHPGAQKTDAYQATRNLLLSRTAEFDAKPELEIYANDVKCSHGATTGQLDATALFYLRSRGISETDARVLLIRAFAQSVLASVGNAAVREHLDGLLAHRFGSLEVSP
jgi:Fe-S cluster assembly protein SufD